MVNKCEEEISPAQDVKSCLSCSEGRSIPLRQEGCGVRWSQVEERIEENKRKERKEGERMFAMLVHLSFICEGEKRMKSGRNCEK